MSTQIGRQPSDEQFDTAAATLKLLADPTRLRIIWALLHGEHPVNELAEHVGVQASAVSQHLAKLRLARIVAARQEGTRVFYRLTNEHARQLVTDAIFQAEHALGGTPAHHARAADLVSI